MSDDEREAHLSLALDSIEANLRDAQTLKRRMELALGFSVALNITLIIWMVTR